MQKQTVVMGILGTNLDQGKSPKRWQRWRPTVSVCQQEDLLVDRYELLYEQKYEALKDIVVKDIRSVSPDTEVVAHPVSMRDPWDFEEVYSVLYDFAREYKFVPEKEDYLLNITTGTHVAQICMYLLAESRHVPGKLLQGSPRTASGKAEPNGSVHIIDLDLSRYDKIAMRKGEETQQGVSFLKAGIATKNRDFNRMIEQIEQVAIASAEPILLMGPTGAGKTQLARRIFKLKEMKRLLQGSLVEVNCATLRGDNAMSTLFGHHKGAFTGAVTARQGLLKAADGGLIFLDEIGELGLDEQAMLLRAIEQKTFLPMGSDKEVASDFQMIAGTNRDLVQDVKAGKFREDLLARINLWTYQLPGLAERAEDIEPNLEYELDSFSAKTGTQVRFSTGAKRRFLRFAKTAPWRGNFRDLNAAVTRMATLAQSGRITEAVVDDEIARLQISWGSSLEHGLTEIRKVLDDDEIADIDRFDVVQLEEVLSVCSSARSLSEAGRKLFQASRARRKSVNDADRLKKYLARFGVTTDMLFGE